MPTLSIIIPVFNEAATLGELLRRVEAAPLPSEWTKELIIVNDGSTDGTESVVNAFCAGKGASCPVRHLAQPANQGKGACLRLGLGAATGDAILIQDADLEYDPRDYHRMVDALVEQEADVVYGSRFLSGQRVTAPFHRLVNGGLTMLTNFFSGSRLTDVYTCLKLFRTNLIKSIELKEDRFGVCIEVSAKLARKPDLKWIEVPVSYKPRTHRLGKKIGIRDGLRALYCIAKYARRPRSVPGNVGQTSCLPVGAASCRPNDGAGTPREPAGWKPALLFQTRSQQTREGPAVPWLWLGVTLMGSLLLRVSLFDFESVDYRVFLSRWYDFFVEQGRWQGLGAVTVEVADYPPLYLTLLSLGTLLPLPKLYAIKLLSIAGDYLAAGFVWRLARTLCPDQPRRAWLAVTAFLFLPTVVLNGALWGQCDVLYTTGFLASLYYVMVGRPVAALVAFGISCSLKPQAVFWCPLLAGLFFSGRLPWKWLWIPPAVYAACGVPSLLAGRPVLEVLGHWALVKNLPGLTLHAPNWYQWVGTQESAVLRIAGIALTLLAAVLFVRWVCKGPPEDLRDSQWLALAALVSVLFPPFLLPGMHERYFFAADVLAVVYALGAARGWVVVLLMQFASGFAYFSFLFGTAPIPETILPFAVVAAFEWLVLGRLRPVSAHCRTANAT